MTDDPNEQGAPVPGLRRIDHVGVVIDDLAEAGRLLADTLGLARVRGTETAGLRTAFYRCGDASIEVIELLDPESRRERLGDGVRARIEHIAIEVDDLDRTLRALQALGTRAKAPPRTSGEYLTFWTEPVTSDGVMLQFLVREPRPPAGVNGCVPDRGCLLRAPPRSGRSARASATKKPQFERESGPSRSKWYRIPDSERDGPHGPVWARWDAKATLGHMGRPR